MTAEWDVMGFGAVAVDDFLYVDTYPAPDSKVPVRRTRREGGGLAGTALVAAARLGARAAFCGVLGDNDLSRFTLDELLREGVDCSPVVRYATARPLHSVVIVEQPTGQRSILYSVEGVSEVPSHAITADLIARCRVLLVDFTVPVSGLEAAQLARQLDIPVVGDIELFEDPRVNDLLPLIDHLVLGTAAAAHLSGQADPVQAALALAAGRTCCVVTGGAQGCWYLKPGGTVQHVPALKVAVVDTTGCGDVFHGAYAASLTRGESIDRAVRVATVAAGLKAAQPGGRTGIPSRAEVDRYLTGTLTQE